MTNTAANLLKVAASVALVMGIGCAAVVGLALFLDPWHSANCAQGGGPICNSVLLFVGWWWAGLILAFIPATIVVTVFFVRKWFPGMSGGA